MKKTIFPFLAVVFLFLACRDSGFKVLQLTDSNGYKYETVQGDKSGLRIYTLDNGLKAYISVNKNEPRIFGLIGVAAGSVDDPIETTGLAHYFEHIMFKGSSSFGTSNWEAEKPLLDSIANLFELLRSEKEPALRKAIYKAIDQLSIEASKYAIPNEYDKMVSEMGAKYTNAFTNYEVTAYMNDIPANELGRWLALEHNRFGEVALRLFHTELETVYEEFNMYQDMDEIRADGAYQKALFPNSAFGRDIIGLPEHLKNPSMINIMEFKNNWYVPNNMVICLSGDLDPEAAIVMIDQTFGQMEQSEVPQRQRGEEKEPIKEAVHIDVFGPDEEFLLLGWRIDNPDAKTRDLLYITDQLLSNGTAGLFDLDLVQNQKALEASSYVSNYDGYGVLNCQANPLDGQSLEQLRDLLLSTIEKVKMGDFPDWMPEAIANQYRLSSARQSRENWRAFQYLDCFIYSVPWIDVLQRADRLERISKKEIMDFASQYFGQNFVAVYKREGEPGDLITVPKPDLSRIEINRDEKSAFYAEWQLKAPEPVAPEFLLMDSVLSHSTLKEGLEFSYQKNESDDFFTQYYIIDAGKLHHPLAPIAFNFLEFIGTETYEANALKQELFRYGLSTMAYASDDRIWVYISGLQRNFEKGLEIMEELLTRPKATEENYQKYAERIIKERNDQKLSADNILWQGLWNQLVYGPKSAFNTVLSDEEIRNIKADSLLNVVSTFMNYPHRAYYYGPAERSEVSKTLSEKHNLPSTLQPIPEPVRYPELPIAANRVLFSHYPMSQINLILLGKGPAYSSDLHLATNLFNQYFGNSMSSVVFQEIREAQGLAYAAYLGFNTPSRPDRSFYLMGFIGTQPDKMLQATGSFSGLLRNMIRNEQSFEVAQKSILNMMASERIRRERVFFQWLRERDLKLDFDLRRANYEAAQSGSLDQLASFFDQHIKNTPYSYLVVGDSNLIDKKALRSLGQLEIYDAKTLFGY